MIKREEVLNQIYAAINEWDKDKRKPSLEVVRKSIFQIYDSIDEELEAREENTARIRKRKDDLYEELGRYRQEYTKIKQKLDSIGTCESCKYSKQSRTFSLKPIKDRFDCSYLSLQMKPKGFHCGDFERKQ